MLAVSWIICSDETDKAWKKKPSESKNVQNISSLSYWVSQKCKFVLILNLEDLGNGIQGVDNLSSTVITSDTRRGSRHLLVEPPVFRWVHLIQLVQNSPHSFVSEVVQYLLQAGQTRRPSKNHSWLVVAALHCTEDPKEHMRTESLHRTILKTWNCRAEFLRRNQFSAI